MPESTDPTALPDEVHEVAYGAIREKWSQTNPGNSRYILAHDAIDAVTPILAAHFAAEAVRESHGRELHHFETEVENEGLRAELDGLRAQIEEARALHTRGKSYHPVQDGLVQTDDDLIEDGCQYCEVEWPCDTATILAQSPRGTVARIQAQAFEDAASDIWWTTATVTGEETKRRLLARAAELREGAGQ